MKIFLTAVITAALLLSESAASPKEEALQMVKTHLAESLSLLQEDADKNIDLSLEALSQAYKAGTYGGHQDTEAVRKRLIDAGSVLKTEIATLRKEANSSAANPAALLVNLSKQQATSLKITRWLYRVGGMTDLALASSKGGDRLGSQFVTRTIETHETFQDTTEVAIQLIATRVLGP